jgi:hypothetical protein
MQVLGEVSATSGVVEESPAAKIAGSLTRGQFLKGVGGTALAMTYCPALTN